MLRGYDQLKDRMISRSQEEFRRSFEDNFVRLVSAGERFDAGQNAEAITIAGIVYVIVHEGGKRSPSALTLLGRKSAVGFHDSGRPINPNNLITFQAPLTQMIFGSGISIQATKDADPSKMPPLPFSKWWEGHVLRDHGGRLFSRKNLIHYFRNTLGAGHVGKQFEGQDQLDGKAFADLGNAFASSFELHIDNQKVKPRHGPEFATVRQIGWELEQSLRVSCADLVPDIASAMQNMQPVVT